MKRFGRSAVRAVVAAGLVLTLAFGVLALSAPQVAAQQQTSPRFEAELVAVDRPAGSTTVEVALLLRNVDEAQPPNVRVIGVDGASATIESLEASPAVALVLDASGSMAGARMVDAKAAAQACIDQMPDGVDVGLVTYADSPLQVIEPSQERNEVRSVIAFVEPGGETATFDSVIAAADLLPAAENIGERSSRYLVLLSDGEDTVSEATAAEAIDRLAGSGFELHALGIAPDGEFFSTLESLTAGTNGRLIVGSAADLGTLCAGIVERIEARYQVTVTLDAPIDGGFELAVGSGGATSTVAVPAAVEPVVVDGDEQEQPSTESEPAEATVGAGGGGSSSSSSMGEQSGGGTVVGDDRPVAAVEFESESGGGEGSEGGVLSVDVAAGSNGNGESAIEAIRGGLPTEMRPPATARNSLAASPVAAWAGAASVSAALVATSLLLIPARRIEHGLQRRLPRRTGLLTRASVVAQRVLERSRWSGAIERMLELAGMTVRPGEFVVGVAMGSIGPALVLLLLGLRVSALAILVLVPTAALIWVRRKARGRARKFESQLGDTLLMLAGSLRSGSSTIQALSVAADKAASPTGEELQRVVAESRIGRDLVASLEDLSERMRSEDARWMVEAIGLNRELGGNLANTLDNLAATIRSREEIRSQVKVMSAEGRLTAAILIGLPFGVAALLQVINPGYLAPLFTDPSGNIILFAALGLLAIGGFWVSRLIKLEY